MRFTAFLGLIALAGSVVPGLTGQQQVSAAPATAGCTGPFTQVASPSPGTGTNTLNATATVGAHGLWAVGEEESSAQALQNLILFDGGHGWSQVASPDPGTVQDVLSAVSASGPADAWAVGHYFTGSTIALQTLHWNGSSWALVPFPVLPHEINDGVDDIGIVDISPGDAWLVGSQLNGGPVLAHWDGTAWSLVTPPAGVGGLRAVAASGPDDVWAVGWTAAASGIWHYNGKAWRKSATLPTVGLSAVTSVSRTEAWAVGSTGGGAASDSVEWNGSAWHVVPTPVLSYDNTLYAVSGTVSGGVWAVGADENDTQPMALHWDGTAWTAVPATGTAASPAGGTGGDTGTFLGVATPTPSRVVVAGFGYGAGTTLVAHLCPVEVRDTGFTPAVAHLSDPGAAAYWEFPASDKANHDLADGTGFGLFDSGAKAPGSTYAFAFPASGTYTVTDRSDGAIEKVRVPIELIANYGQRQVELSWASQAPPAGAKFQVQMMAPGSTTFAHLWDTTKLAHVIYRTLVPGTYKFRSRMRDKTTGAATGWSPALIVTVS